MWVNASKLQIRTLDWLICALRMARRQQCVKTTSYVTNTPARRGNPFRARSARLTADELFDEDFWQNSEKCSLKQLLESTHLSLRRSWVIQYVIANKICGGVGSTGSCGNVGLDVFTLCLVLYSQVHCIHIVTLYYIIVIYRIVPTW